MSRWVIAIALSWSTWAAVQPAVAHARSSLSSELGAAMCGEGAQTVLLEELALGRPVSIAPIAQLDEEAGSPGLRPSQAQQQDEAPHAWCISPDDPRCAPRDHSAPLQGPRALVPMQDAAAMRWPDLDAQSGSVTLRPEQLGAPKAGVGLRVERPPRGC